MEEQQPGPAIRNATVVLVVEHPAIRELLALKLKDAGFFVMAAATHAESRELIGEMLPDAMLVDMDSKTLGGAALIDQVRSSERTMNVPILRVTAASYPCCDSGVDACVCKPYAPHELVHRMIDLLRRTRTPAVSSFRFGPLLLLPDRREAMVDRDGKLEPVAITATEFRLLHHMATHPDRVHSRAQLLKTVWTGRPELEPRTVDVSVKRLRECLRCIGLEDIVRTVPGVGYRIDYAKATTAGPEVIAA